VPQAFGERLFRREGLEEGGDAWADGGDVVAAFLDEEGGEVEGAEAAGDFGEGGEGEAEVADGVGVGDVGADGDEEGVGMEVGDFVQGGVEGLEPVGFGGAAREGEVDVEAGAGAIAGLLWVAPEVGVLRVGVSVQGEEEDVRSGVEDVLGAVAVVVVEVEDGEALHGPPTPPTPPTAEE